MPLNALTMPDTPPESFGDLDEVVEFYTAGQCHALGMAIRELTGWPLYMLCDVSRRKYQAMARGEIPGFSCCHVVAKPTPFIALDITGLRYVDELREEWEGSWNLTHMWRIPASTWFNCWGEQPEMDLAFETARWMLEGAS